MTEAEGGTRSFRLVLEYDGAGFEGWQTQAGPRPARTVQGVLIEAVASVTGETPRVRGAGRTDAGVHAEAQVASLHVATALAPERLQAALNARLPDDVAVRGLTGAAPGWDALRAARGKHYRYRIWNGAHRSPLRAGTTWWVRERLDASAMAEAAAVFVGRHDFAAFQAAGSSVKTTVRTVTGFRVAGESGGALELDVEGEGFLRHMVRNLAGTLVEIGRGRWAVARAAEILASRDRGQAGPTAPAQGLCLLRVDDDDGGGPSPAGTDGAATPGSVDSEGPVG
ncbi:MAG: tRNA pseudouridine(38-40) synthase TruA [Planctomycetota bacterium]